MPGTGVKVDPVVRGAAGQPARVGREEPSMAVWGAGLQPEETEVKPRVG